MSPHVSANTRYYFRLKAFVTRTGGNNNPLQLAWSGTSALSQITYTVNSKDGALGTVGSGATVDVHTTSGFATPVSVTSGAAAAVPNSILITGIVDVGNTGGTLQPTIGWASIPGVVTTFAHSNFHIYPVSSTANDTVVGNWS